MVGPGKREGGGARLACKHAIDALGGARTDLLQEAGDLGAERLLARLPEVRLREARAGGGDGDARGAELVMHRARDAEQKGLGRSVRGLGWPRVKALDRAYRGVRARRVLSLRTWVGPILLSCGAGSGPRFMTKPRFRSSMGLRK